METWLFYPLGGIALIAAINVLAQRRVFYSAISLIVCLSTLAGIYLLLEAPLIAALQVILYAGAIMVLFLFVIMLLDPFSVTPLADKKRYLGCIAVLLGAAALGFLYQLLKSYDLSRVLSGSETAPMGNAGLKYLSETLFKDYLLPFEVTSILILVAIIGAVVLAKRRT